MSVASARLQTAVSFTLRKVVLNPLLTGPLLWLLTRAPDGYRSKAFELLEPLASGVNKSRLLGYLQTSFVLGLIRGLNWGLNSFALSKWQLTNRVAWDWSKEVAVVTGGCGGIGALIVQGLVTKGIKVAVLDIQELPSKLSGNKDIEFIQCDITNDDEVKQAAAAITLNFGTPSILINNAGICPNHTILNTSSEYLKKIFAVNVMSNYYTVQAFLPAMLKARKGHVVTMASCASNISVSNMVDYCATKAAVLSFHEGLIQELKHRYKVPEICTTIIHPHFTQTTLLDPMRSSLKAANQYILDPQEVADAAVKQVLSGRSRQIFLPSSFDWQSGLKGLPHWLQELARDGLGYVVV